jgi:predicted DNA-binding transcriptional regulator AlpA
MPIDITSIPRSEIPMLIAALLARLLEPTPTPVSTVAASSLLDASQLADKLGVPKSWVREQSRLGHIPVVRLGRYCRYRLAEVEAAIARRDGH